jgi:hypothetical protein
MRFMDRVRFKVRVQVIVIAIFMVRHSAVLGLGLGCVLGVSCKVRIAVSFTVILV